MGILDIIYPRKCVGCGEYGQYLCHNCLGKVSPAQSRCVVCKRLTVLGKTHPECIAKSPFQAVYSIWQYGGVVRKAILALKYRFASDLAEEIACTACKQLKSTPVFPEAAVLIPIPLHNSRQKWRGFNQSEEIGKIIAVRMGWQFEPKLLKRVKKTEVQARLSREKRLQNIKGVFEVDGNIQIDKPIVIFDDVLTTGSTLIEAGKALKKQGMEIWGLTLAS